MTKRTCNDKKKKKHKNNKNAVENRIKTDCRKIRITKQEDKMRILPDRHRGGQGIPAAFFLCTTDFMRIPEARRTTAVSKFVSRKRILRRCMRQRSMRQRSMRQRSVRQRSMRQRSVRQRSVRQRSVRQRSVRRQSVRGGYITKAGLRLFCVSDHRQSFSGH